MFFGRVWGLIWVKNGAGGASWKCGRMMWNSFAVCSCSSVASHQNPSLLVQLWGEKTGLCCEQNTMLKYHAKIVPSTPFQQRVRLDLLTAFPHFSTAGFFTSWIQWPSVLQPTSYNERQQVNTRWNFQATRSLVGHGQSAALQGNRRRGCN